MCVSVYTLFPPVVRGDHTGDAFNRWDLISLPVDDDWVRGGLVSVAATFLLATAAEWAVKETEKRKKKSQSVRGEN